MSFRGRFLPGGAATMALLMFSCLGCGSGGRNSGTSTNAATVEADAKPASISPADAAPPALQTGGFDGAKAYSYVEKLVSFGPHPPDTPAIRNVQSYIRDRLKGFGCRVDVDDFHAQTPIGTLAMENIVAKIPGTGPGVILLLTHYDTLRLPGFVGAEDSGSSTGLMLEMASLLCSGQKRHNAVWIAFLDGEEAQLVENGEAQWTDADSVFGSRELAARMDLSGDLKNVKAVILADMIGQKNLHIVRESSSTKWLTDLVWKTADRLGYGNIFLNSEAATSDDHIPFIQRGAAAVDIIDLQDFTEEGYWHTTQDTLDKLSPRNIAIVGHVILASLDELQEELR
ncbi:MAG: M28 family peptidase [Acidobacteriota bacterium]|nr:M28 family peptidase [Acidobacteriota bacterium]